MRSHLPTGCKDCALPSALRSILALLVSMVNEKKYGLKTGDWRTVVRREGGQGQKI